MKAYIFPGQGSQFPGMGKDLYDKSEQAREMFRKADEILGISITSLMFNGAEEDLRQTSVTQPAIFLHSVIQAAVLGDKFTPGMVAGHSLGEFSSLVANGSLSFNDGLVLVSKRAAAMQKACELAPSTMAAIIGLDDNTIGEVCASVNDIVVPANYNCPGQVVISGTISGIDRAIELLRERGARRALKLSVGGAFHSPLMEPARTELESAIRATKFSKPVCPVYQNVTALPSSDPETIKSNLVLQLTSPVFWTQSILNMMSDGASAFIETGPGNVLQGLIKKINRDAITESAVI